MAIWSQDMPRAPRVRRPNLQEVAQFGGLNLRDDPQEIGWQGAVDLLNVDARGDGQVRTRYGLSRVGTYTAGNLLQVFTHSSSAILVRELSPGRLRALTTAGVEITNVVTGTSTMSFARFGDPSTAATYYAEGTVGKFNGTAFSTPAAFAALDYRLVAVQPNDNRLVFANSAADDGSKIQFSNAGAPETLGSNDYVRFRPGDGERVHALVGWAPYLFAFKQTHFAVFNGNSTDSSGNPIFNYREVNSPEGAGLSLPTGNAASRYAVGGKEGVYYVTPSGIYRTTGGVGRKISGVLDPLFDITGLGFSAWQGDSSLSGPTLSYADGRLYVHGAEQSFVYDEDRDLWMAHAVNGAALRDLAVFNGTLHLGYYYGSGDYRLGSFSTSATDDAGSAITSRYRTGFADFGSPGTEKLMQEVLFDGTGTVSPRLAANDGDPVGSQTVTLGTAPAIGSGRLRQSRRGRNFSLEVSSTSGRWSLARAVARVNGERGAGLGSA